MNNCKNCNKEYQSSKYGNFCSNKCNDEWKKLNKKPNIKCLICGKPFFIKKYRIKRCKNGVTCSKECSLNLRSLFTNGKNNHQFGLKGELNSSFKGLIIPRINHKITDLFIYVKNHPFSNKDSRVLYHRYLVEQNYKLFNIDSFVVIDGEHFLKKEYDVHHIDFNHDNNSLDNLEVLTRGDHSRLHGIKHVSNIKRNSKGQFLKR